MEVWEPASGTLDLLSASGANGIVPQGGGAAWGGVFEAEIPFP